MTVNSSARTQWVPTAAAATKDSPWQGMEGTALVSKLQFDITKNACIFSLMHS
jgi:hypothetical protein